jgi:DNA-binding transcriptional LysR family regulator
MELRHLRYFLAVAEELSFTRAAKRLNMAQPPLSQQIRQLENELGVPLLTRTSRRIALTYPGQVFLKEARSVLELVDNAVSAARRAQGRAFGSLTIGAGVIPIQTVLSRVLPQFRTKFPGVDLRLRELLPYEQSGMLREGSVDISFVIPPFEHDELAAELVVEDPVVAVLPTDHRLAQKDSIALRALAAERFVMPNRAWAPTFHDHLIALCRKAGFSPAVVHTAGDFQTIFTLVGAGLGVGLTTCSTRAISVEGVTCVPVRSAAVPVWMAWRNNDPNPAVQGFLDLVRAAHNSAQADVS